MQSHVVEKNMKAIIRGTGKLTAIVLSVILVVLVGLRIAATLRETQTADAAAPRSGLFVTTSMGRFFVSTAGPVDGKPVILIHGSGAWGGLWEETSAALGARGYRTIALDLPPFGFSDRPSSGDYRRSTQARRILALADAMQLDRPMIVGHSFGGGPALEAAMQAPRRFNKVVLVDPALGIDAPITPLPLYLRSQTVRSTLVAAAITNPMLTQRMLEMLIYRKDRARSYVAVLQRPLGRAGTTEAIATWLPYLVNTDATSLSAHSSNYRRNTLSLSLIWGDRDTVTPVDQLARLHALVPAAPIRLLHDVGHIPQIEKPSAFQEALLAALTQ